MWQYLYYIYLQLILNLRHLYLKILFFPRPIMEELEKSSSSDTDGRLMGLPETESELDNLTEFNTAHNRRITMIGIFKILVWFTVFPRMISAETILFWIWPYLLWPFVTVHKSEESIRGNAVCFGSRVNSRLVLYSVPILIWQKETCHFNNDSRTISENCHNK